MSDRHVVLGMPGYGKQSAAAGRGFWRACSDMTRVDNIYSQGSLLASNFNSLWCAALNRVNEGGLVDYFAMLHDDIGPDDFWLDTLIDELEANKLDVLGVAVPIKDTRGLTSLALQRDGDNWMADCRLSMRDLFELPETFTSADIGKNLLLNTGCWVCKFDIEWAKKVHFEINDRIVFNRVLNRYQAQTESEDWYFSRLLHELGLNVGATRKVKVMHRGEIDFSNSKPWGSNDYDREYVTKSPIATAFPYDVPGWLKPDEGKELARLAAGKRVLEIGSFCGLSTICIARTAKHVTAVDYFDARGTGIQIECTREIFEDNIKRHGVADKITVQHPDEAIESLAYGMAFIDGSHDYESVVLDIEKAIAALAPDGFIAFHDYKNGLDKGVDNAVNELIERGGELINVVESIAVVRPPANFFLEV